MKNRLLTVAIGVCAVLMMTMTFSADATAKTIYKFGGGPAGGTFQFMAGGISTYPPVKAIKEFRVLAGASGGGGCRERIRYIPRITNKSLGGRLCSWYTSSP